MASFWDNLVGAFTGQAAEDAADAQVDALNASIAESRRVGEEVEQDLAPFSETGVNSLFMIADLLGIEYPGAVGTREERSANALNSFQTSPGFDFRLQGGVDALDRSASARGKRQSGPQLKALESFGQDFASNEFNNYLSSLFGVAGSGQEAVTSGVNAKLGVGSDVSNSLASIGTARASGFIGAQNIFSDTTNSLLELGGRFVPT